MGRGKHKGGGGRGAGDARKAAPRKAAAQNKHTLRTAPQADPGGSSQQAEAACAAAAASGRAHHEAGHVPAEHLVDGDREAAEEAEGRQHVQQVGKEQYLITA